MHKRGMVARLGVSALNLVTPGLGLLRIGKIGVGLSAITCSFAANAAVAAYYSSRTELSFRAFAIFVGLSIAYLLIVSLGSILLTFRHSWVKPERLLLLSRWYVLLPIGVASLALGWLMPPIDSYYRAFSIPALSMEPALHVGERFVATMAPSPTLQRGDVVIVRRGDIEFVKRIAGIPGDRIGLVGGRVRLNGMMARYENLSDPAVTASCDGARPRMLREWVGEGSRSTIVVDCGPSSSDEFSDVVVPAGHYFLLGDNRDLSADSRIDEGAFGLGMVPARDIIGRALFIYWSNGKGRIGTAVE